MSKPMMVAVVVAVLAGWAGLVGGVALRMETLSRSLAKIEQNEARQRAGALAQHQRPSQAPRAVVE